MKLSCLLFIVFIMLVLAVIVSGCSNTTGTMSANTSTTNTSETPGPAMVWQHRFGGPGWDQGTALVQTSEGGYAITGMKETVPARGNDSNYTRGFSGMLLLRTDPGGNELWNKTYGGWDSSGSTIVRTSDGGFAMMGENGYSGTLLVKTDALGNELWNRTYKWNNQITIPSFVMADDGGYVLTGGIGRAVMNYKVLLFKVDAGGNALWNRTYNMSGSGCSIIRTTDGGYAIAGNGISGKPFILKTDSSGNEVWSREYEPVLMDTSLPTTGNNVSLTKANKILQAEDGGFALAGTTSQLSYNTSGDVKNKSEPWSVTVSVISRYFLIKTDVAGNMAWVHTYGSGDSELSDVIRTNDGGYALAGMATDNATASVSESGISAGTNFTVRLVRADANGNEAWIADYRILDNNQCMALIQAQDGGYVVTGRTISSLTPGLDFDLFLLKTA